MPLKDPDGQEESEEDATIAAAAEDVSNSGQKRTAVGRNGVSSSNKPRQLSSLPSSSSSRRISRYGYEKEEGEEQERRVPAGIEETLNKARAVEASGSYTEEAFHTGGQGKVKSVCAGVRVGRGLGLYHKFAQGEFFFNSRPEIWVYTASFFLVNYIEDKKKIGRQATAALVTCGTWIEKAKRFEEEHHHHHRSRHHYHHRTTNK